MATTRVDRRSRKEQYDRHAVKVTEQPHRFLGLFLAVPAGLLTSWLIHVWTLGVDLHWGPIDWTVRASAAAPYVAVALITAATIGLAVLAWHFAEHRKAALRSTLTGSVAAIGALFAINVGTGPHYWWSGLFVLVGWFVAITWSIVRLDVTRNDKHEGDEHDDSLLERLNLKGWRVRKVRHRADDRGEPLASEVEFQHAPGDTVDQLQEAVPGVESATGRPGGLSSAIGDPDRADRSTLTLMHQDPLRHLIALPPTSSPGGSITDPLVVGTYRNGQPVHVFLGGGPVAGAPSVYLYMGMSRSGKTVTENEMLTELQSRRDVVILYLNRAKGLQDIRPVIPGIEAVVVDDSGSGAPYRTALKMLKRIMSYRSRQLGLFGISAWSAQECFHNPPWRTDEHGKRVRMEPMPALIAHVGEADDILANLGDEGTYVVSKGLSLGVISGFSLQRASWKSMPTDLRYNINTAFCFGTGDDESAEFALSRSTIKAGARPDQWKARKPGYFYLEGLGIDETLFPVAARSFGIAAHSDADLPQDERSRRLAAELIRRNMSWASRMARLDAGSVQATALEEGGTWWDAARKDADDLRAAMLHGAVLAAPQTPSASSQVAGPDEDDDLDEEMERMREEMREISEVEGTELYPADLNMTVDDATTPVRVDPPSDDEVSWDEDDLPAPRDRAAALAAVLRALDELLADETIRDPDDPTGRTVLVTSGMIAERYTFRKRPFFVAVLADIADGEIDAGDRILERADDLGAHKGIYRLYRATADHAA
jgi:hypothetical protein